MMKKILICFFMNKKCAQEIETVTIEKIVFEGKGMGRMQDGKIAFVQKALTGETVDFCVLSQKRKRVEGWAQTIKNPSPDRRDPVCPFFEKCAGCSFQNLSYEKQLEVKDTFLTESLVRLGGFEESAVKKWKKPIIPAQNQLHYRNKTEFSFSDNEGTLRLGFHNPLKRFYVLPHNRCFLNSPHAQKAFETAQSIALRSGLDVFDLAHNPQGFLFSLTLRTNYQDQILVVFNTHQGDFPPEEKKLWVEALKNHLGGFLRGIVQVQKDRKETASEPKTVVLWGEETLWDRVGDLDFEIGPRSFFQVHREMAHVMVQKLQEYIRSERGRKHVLDLFCGNGFLGMSIAREVEQVTGIEINPDSVREGEKNKQKNGIDNYTFYAGEARKVLRERMEKGDRFDRVIVDPPRGGLGRKTVKTIAKIQAPGIFYISCNPTTLARDLDYFVMCGYEIVSLQALDLFPQTYHLETLCELKKVKNYEDAKKEWIDGGKEWK